jgi:DnaJ-class molecular chaperone
MPKNLYDVLEVSKDASDKDIKSAYRRLSLEFHPDKNSAEEATERFQEIREAYEILSDPQKKEEYDFEQEHGGRGGFHGFPFGGGGGNPFNNQHNDIHDIFNMMFSGGGGGFPGGGFPMGGMGPNIRIFHNGIPVIQKPSPIQKEISITLEQSFTGIPSVQIKFDRVVVVQQIQSSEEETITLNIPAGISDGETIVLQEKGHVIQDKVKGDLHLLVKVQIHKEFSRNGMDLIYRKTLTLKEALCGFSLEIPHLSGKMLRISHSATSHVIKPNEKKPIPGYGMVKNGQTGNLIIDFDISFPDKLTEEQIKGLQNIL